MSKQCILLAEDNPDDAELTLRAFHKARLTNPVEVVSNGVRALEYLHGENSYIRKPVDFNTFIQSVQQFGLYWLLLNELPYSI